MREYLIFQLYGPMASWGDIAVGEDRPSALVPTKSAILGLVAAALGIKRPDTALTVEDRQQWESQHINLAQGYGIAMRVDWLGTPLADYHTSEVPRGNGYMTRRDEVMAIKEQKRSGVQFKGTILSRREFRQDVFCAVALWAQNDAPYALSELKTRLIEPVFMLYLGRKACPLALPVNPQIISEMSFEKALSNISCPPEPSTCFKRLPKERPLFIWDYDAGAQTELTPLQTVDRRDAVLSRQRWQFAVRRENQAYGGDYVS